MQASGMAAYVIVELEVTEPVEYEQYKKVAGATVEKYGGKYIVRGGACETLGRRLEPKTNRRFTIRRC